MSLILKPAPPKVVVLTEDGLATLSVSTESPATVALQTGDGVYSLEVSTPILRTVAVQTANGLVALSLEMMEAGGVPAWGFRLDYGTAVLKEARKVLGLSSSVVLEVTYKAHTIASNMWVPERVNIARSLAYRMGQLTSRTQLTRFSYTMGRLYQRVRPLDFTFYQYVITTENKTLAFSTEFRNWDRLCVEFSNDTGVNHLAHGIAQATNTVGVLENAYPKFTVASKMGQLTNETKGFGFEYTMERINPPVFTDFNLAADIHSKEGAGFEEMQVTLGWAQLAQADRLDWHLGYSNTYVAFPEFRLSYARTFTIVYRHFTLAASKERHLLGATELLFPFGVRGGVDLLYSLQAVIVAGAEIPVPLRASCLGGFEIDFKMNVVAAGVDVPVALNAFVFGGLELQMILTPSIRRGVELEMLALDSVAKGTDIVYALLVNTPVVAGNVLSSPLSDTSPIVMSQTFSLPDPTGATDGIELLSADVTAEEGTYGWSGTFVLRNPADLNKFSAHSLFSFTIGADTYAFVVDSKQLNRTSPTEHTATVRGISPSAKLVAPRAKLITKTWVETTTAYAIIEEVAGGYPLDISIINWAIPANRFGVEATDPMAIITQLVTAVGGVVDTLIDGTLRLRPKYPISTNLWGPGVADHIYSDFNDHYDSNDNDAPLRVFNKFRIMDAEVSDSGDKLEYTSLDSVSGEVRAYPSPWRTTCYLDTTSPSCTIGAPTVEYRDEEEVIEIYEGQGQVRYSVFSVNALQWLEIDLLGVVAGDDSTTITSTHATEKYSLLKISYKTRCLVYPVSGAVEQQAQFLLRNP